MSIACRSIRGQGVREVIHLFTTHYSLLTPHDSQLGSRLTVHGSRLAIHNSLLILVMLHLLISFSKLQIEMSKKPKSKRQPVKKQLKWIIISAVVIVAAGITYRIIDSRVKDQLSNTGSTKNEMSADLVRANKLTQDVYYYVEQVEMKKMTQEEANKFSNPIKAELQSVRSQLSKEELMYNDSIRKAYGNIMVDNVMRWRKENGLLVPEDSSTFQSN